MPDPARGGAEVWRASVDKDKQPVCFQEIPCFDMLWDGIDFAHSQVVAAPFGGPVAVLPLPSRVGQGDDAVRFFTAVGKEIGAIYPDLKDTLRQVKGATPHHAVVWTADLQLCIVYRTGTIELWTTAGEKEVKPGSDSNSIALVSFIPSCVVLITSGGDVNYVAAGRNEHLHDMAASSGMLDDVYEAEQFPQAMAAWTYDDDIADDGDLNIYGILVTVGEDSDDDDGQDSDASGGGNNGAAVGGLYVMTRMLGDTDEGKVTEVRLPAGVLPITAAAVSPNGRLAAFWNPSGKLHIFSTDMKEYYNAFETPSFGGASPKPEVMWAGDLCVAMVLHPDQLTGAESMVVMVGVHGGHAEFTFDGHIHVASEIDSLRVVTARRTVLLERVARELVDTFREGSTEPGARLFGAYLEYDQGASGAVASIRDLKEKSVGQHRQALGVAIETLMHAAGCHWEQATQQLLLKAASYGRCFHKGDDLASRFVEQCEALRVLNAVRRPEVGMPLTLPQYQALSPPVLIDRLLQLQLYALAYKICVYLNLDTQKSLNQWACAKVSAVVDGRSVLSDEDLATCIKDRFKCCPTISFLDVAKTAHQAGKTQLALALLDAEPKSEIQVQLLCEMGEYAKGLLKATLAKDTDLVYWVFLKVMRQASDDDLYRTVTVHPVAQDIFIAYCEKYDQGRLMAFYKHQKLHKQVAMQTMDDYLTTRAATRKNYDREDELLGEAKAKYGKGTLEEKLVGEQIKLSKKQRQYAQKHKDPGFLTESACGTLRLLIYHKDNAEADELRKHLDLPMKVFYWAKLQALCEFGRWSDLQAFAKQKKNPIGYFPFVRECIRRNAHNEGKQYAKKLSDYGEMIEAYYELGAIKEAVDVAVSEGDDVCLEELKKRCRNHSAADKKLINDGLDKLR